jgi:membrane associated rhomboid family serine protease
MPVMDQPIPEVGTYLPVLERRPVAWVTWSLAATTIAIFLLQLASLHLFNDDVIGNALAFSPQAVAEHRYWTVLTYAWAHAVGFYGIFWLHIVANMIPLICLGPALEQILGHLRFLGLYLGGAIAAALVWYFFTSPAGSDDAIIGASGAVFAIIAGIGVAIPRVRVTVLLFFIIPLRMSMGLLAIVACGIEGASMIFGWMPEVAHSAHLGGAAFGALYVLALRWHAQRNRLEY